VIGFANPWAWIGAVGLALPIAVHLLRRHRATRRPFPTLRFLPDARVVAVRRHRLTDVPLMIVRMLAIAAAVVAVTQPVWRDRSALSAIASKQLARAVVIDRSPRMTRPAPDGRPASDRANAEVAGLAGASNQVVIESQDVRQALVQAIGWARRQDGDREIVVVSNFPIGSLSASDIDAVPAGVGVRLIQIPIATDDHPAGPALTARGPAGALVPQMTLRPGDTEVSWTTGRSPAPPVIEWRTTREDATGLALATGAALDVGVAEQSPDRLVTIALPEAPDRAQLVGGARAIDRPWMFDVVRGLAADPTLASAARMTHARQASYPSVFTPVVRDADGGTLLASAASGTAESRLLLLSNAPAASVFTAALASAVPEADRAVPWQVFESQSIAADVLARWQRPAALTAPVAPSSSGTSISRWFWALALIWISLETWWRRPEAAAPATMVNERVA
jgi:hypothetical protein